MDYSGSSNGQRSEEVFSVADLLLADEQLAAVAFVDVRLT